MASPSKAEIVSLDVVRGIAAILVMLVHTRDSAFVDYGELPTSEHSAIIRGLFAITRVGHEAVLVFFVLSGFLVFGQVLQRASNGTFDLRSYAIGRLTRILIPLVPACLFTVCISYALGGQGFAVWQIVANVVGLNGVIAPTLSWNAPLWSLAFEVWFYVLGGALGCLIVSRYKSKAAILVLMLCAAVFSVLDARYLLFWMIAGMMAFQLDTRRPGMQAAVGASICAAGVILFELSSSSKSFTSFAIVPQAVAELLICAGFASTLPFLCGDALNRRLAFLNRPAKWISSISFTLYLFHYPINEALSVILPPRATVDLRGIGLFGLRIAVCIGGCAVAYLLFERHTDAARAWCTNLLTKGAKASAAA